MFFFFIFFSLSGSTDIICSCVTGIFAGTSNQTWVPFWSGVNSPELISEQCKYQMRRHRAMKMALRIWGKLKDMDLNYLAAKCRWLLIYLTWSVIVRPWPQRSRQPHNYPKKKYSNYLFTKYSKKVNHSSNSVVHKTFQECEPLLYLRCS